MDAAVAKCPGIRHVFVMKRTGADVPMCPLDIPLDEVLSLFSCKLKYENYFEIK